MNKVITIEKDDERYEDMMNLVGKATTDNLIIVAKSHENRKSNDHTDYGSPWHLLLCRKPDR